MKAKIKDLTKEQANKICNVNKYHCQSCPLCYGSSTESRTCINAVISNGFKDFINFVNKDTEIIQPYLSGQEKEFLEERLRPFKDEIGSIIKERSGNDTDLYRIRIEGTFRSSLEIIHFSWFKGNTMYQGMEPNRNYTLEDLELFEEE